MPRLTVQQIANQADRIRDDVVGLKGQVNELGEELHEIGQGLRARVDRDRDDFSRLREELAGFHGRLEPLVATLQADYPKFRDDFAGLRSRFDLVLSQAKWAMGILTAVAISLVGFAIKVTWDASAIRRDVTQHSEQINGLADSARKLTENSAKEEQRIASLAGSVEGFVGETRDERQRMRGELVAIASAIKALGESAEIVRYPLERRDLLDGDQPKKLIFRVPRARFSSADSSSLDDLTVESPGISNLSHRLPLAEIRVIVDDEMAFDLIELRFKEDKDRQSVLTLLDKSSPVYIRLKTKPGRRS